MMKDSIRELLGKKLHDHEVAALNSLLAGEISAVETYQQAIQKVKDTELVSTLEQCRNSHAVRIMMLRECLQNLGVLPSESAGVWGWFAQLVEGGATIVGDQAAIAILTAGEYFGLDQYRKNIYSVDPESWKVIQKDIIPRQEQTYAIISALNNTMHAAA